jgi:hypothetical protein
VVIIRGGLGLVIPSSQCQTVFDAVDAPKKLITVRFSGPMVEQWREDWLANQMDSLAAMQGEKPVQVAAMRSAGRPAGPATSARPAAPDAVAPRVRPADSGGTPLAAARVAPAATPTAPPTVVPAAGITMIPDPARFPEADRP